MKVKWNIDLPIYQSPFPDQIIEIDDGDLEDMTEEEKNVYINDVVREEFNERIYYYWNIVKE